ncbi:MAG TPA: cation:proton antiporter [Anaerolineae bacterium]|nr:cation:proton antiporter [Anaerolineae bacterium]
MIPFTVFVLMVFLFGLVSHRLEKTVFTAPMVFTSTGLLLYFFQPALAAILAPTDTGLGEVIVSSPRLPVRIRQALNVESGLNDGLSVPFLMLFIALTQAGSTTAWELSKVN